MDYDATYPLINGESTSYYGAEISGTPTFYIVFPDGTYTNIYSNCISTSSSTNIQNDLGDIVDNWIAMIWVQILGVMLQIQIVMLQF